DLSTEFEDFSDNSGNEVNAVGTIVPTVGQNSLNNTNTFGAAGLQMLRNPRGYIKLSKIQVGLKLYRKSFFSSRCRKFSAFLYGTIEEEVYFCQPTGFGDPDHPDKVYKVVKALYGLHQAPRAWYETLANYLLENGFQRGKIDQTLFIKKQKGDILLVQIYVDDIIFGATNKDLCKSFEKLMKDKF
nr:putative ribonuclease H-like domain-containing protein [Tanacetum cinerariifolium]